MSGIIGGGHCVTNAWTNE